MNDASAPQPDTRRKRLPVKRFLAFICGVGVLVITMLVYSHATGLRMSERYTPLIDATMEIKLEATTAHLRFEEMLAGDTPVTMDKIRPHLAQADWYALAMLNGGTNTEGTFVPLADLELRANIESVHNQIEAFRQQMEMRRRQAGEGSPLAKTQLFHHTFEQLISNTDTVETRLQQLIGESQDRFTKTQLGLALITLLTTAFVAWSFVHFARTQNQTLNDLSREVEQRTKAEESLRRQASTDPLTKLYNRRYITDILQDETKRAKRQSNPFSVVMMDIDHFKSINDTHGHDVGDRVLQAVSKTIAAQLREVDVLARWGGEEFLILLRGTNLGGARQVAEKCRAALAAEAIEEQGQITASFGVAQGQNDESVRDLVHRADIALYAAKSAGRNRVHTA